MVYRICTAGGLYVLLMAEPEEVRVQHEGDTIPCTVKNMRQRTCTDRPYKANRQISFSARMSSTYCTLAVQRKVPYARRCSYSYAVTTLVKREDRAVVTSNQGLQVTWECV